MNSLFKRLAAFSIFAISCAQLFGQAGRFVNTVNTVADLVALNAATIYTNVFVAGYRTAGDGGEGVFTLKRGDSTSTNLGTILPSTGIAGRWFRQYKGDVNLAWFGAGNTADDYLAITSALSLSDKRFYFPAATYTVTDEIIPKAGQTLYGDGFNSILKSSAAFDITKITLKITTSNVVVRALKIDGNSRATHAVSTRANVLNATIENCEVTGGVAAGIECVEGSNNILIKNCYVHDIAGAAGVGIFFFYAVGNSRIEGNFVKDCAAYHILIDGGTSGGLNSPSTNNVVIGNTIVGASQSGWGIGIEGSDHNIVSGNTLSLSPATTYAITVDNDNTTNTKSADDNVIIGNTIVSPNAVGMRINGRRNLVKSNNIQAGDIGITLATPGGTTNEIVNTILQGNTISILGAGVNNKLGILVTRGIGAMITDNKIDSCPMNGISIQNSIDTTVFNNVISNSGRQGINVADANITNLFVINNRVMNSSTSSAGTYSAITINANGSATPSIQGLRAVDNICDDYQAVVTTKNGIEVLGAAGKITLSQVSRNRSLVANINPASILTTDPISGDDFIQVLTGGTLSPDLSRGNKIQVNATSAVTINSPAAIAKGDMVNFEIVQDSTGGRGVTWAAAFLPQWTDVGNIANARSSVSFMFNGTNWIQIGRQKDYGHVTALRSLSVGSDSNPGDNNATVDQYLGIGKTPVVPLDVENATSAEAIFKTTAGNNPAKATFKDAANRTIAIISPNNVGAGYGQIGTPTGHDWALIANNVEHWLLTTAGSLQGRAVANGITFKEGSNARMGVSTLVNGTLTVANTSITANTRVFFTRQVQAGTTSGTPTLGTVVAATSFVINSLTDAAAVSADDDSTIGWLLVEPSP